MASSVSTVMNTNSISEQIIYSIYDECTQLITSLLFLSFLFIIYRAFQSIAKAIVHALIQSGWLQNCCRRVK